MAFDLAKYEIKKAKDTGAPKSILLFGRPKGGKTVMAASIVDVPGYERVLVVDVEGGASAITAHYPQVDVIAANTAADFSAIVEALVNGELVEPESGLPYQVVIIDTLDKAQERQLEVYDKSRESFTKQGEKNTLYKWGAIKTWTTKLADALHLAPFLTIFVAHVMDNENENGTVTTTVALGGSSKFTFPATPDIVGHFTIAKVDVGGGKKEPRRVIDFSVSDKVTTGQRYADALNGSVVDPTMSKLYQKIQPDIFQ